MLKKISALLLMIVFLLSCIPAMAAEEPVIYKSIITVTDEGGRFQVGFVNLEFKKDFLPSDKLPVTFEVVVSARGGIAGVEITPSVEGFLKKVHIRVDEYSGLLYDETLGRNIQVYVKKQQIIVNHFSRYAFS